MNNVNKKIDSLMDKVAEKPEAVISEQTVLQTVYEFFEKQVSEQAPKKLDKIAADILLDDIGMDSLEVLSVAMDLEEHFQLFIPDKDIQSFTTIQEVADYLEQAIAATAAEPEEEQNE